MTHFKGMVLLNPLTFWPKKSRVSDIDGDIIVRDFFSSSSPLIFTLVIKRLFSLVIDH
jgi:hypothetical protein